MRRILQQEVVPRLRDLGFRGTIPHFHRERQNRLDLLNIQFGANGQYFFVNLGRLQLPQDSANVVAKPTGEQLNLRNCPLDQRARLAIGILPEKLGGGARPGFDKWNFFADTDAESDALMHKLARQLHEWLPLYADPWWRNEKLSGGAWKIGPGLAS